MARADDPGACVEVERRQCATRVALLERDIEHLKREVTTLDTDVHEGFEKLNTSIKTTYAPVIRLRALEFIVYGTGSILLSKFAEKVFAFFIGAAS